MYIDGVSHRPKWTKKEPVSTEAETGLVARKGFEPLQTESESVVLPLHNRAMSMCSDDNIYLTTQIRICQQVFLIFLEKFFQKTHVP